MAKSADEECGICLDALANPVALPCSHQFCSKCLDSWRSKYGAKGDPDQMGRKCPLCREKIPPSKEMLMQLEFWRNQKKDMEANGDTSSEEYSFGVAKIEQLEQEVGDWTETIDNTEETECGVLPPSVWAATGVCDFQKVFDWLGPPPIDKQRINARHPEHMNITLLFHAVMQQHLGFLSVLLQHGADVNAVNAMGFPALVVGLKMNFNQEARLLLEWGADVDPQHLTKNEFIAEELAAENMKLANLVRSELGGRRCELINFTKSPDLNGKTCVVDKYLPDKDRYKITFEGSGEKALIPPQNLKRRDRTPTDCGYYITFENGEFFRRDFASKEECKAYVAELEAKSAADQLARLDVG